MPISLPSVQTEDLTSSEMGGDFTGFTPRSVLSSPMVGKVEFTYRMTSTCYIRVQIVDMSGVDYRGSISGWFSNSGPPRHYRMSVSAPYGSTVGRATLNIPEGYQLTAAHLGKNQYARVSVREFTVTGLSTGNINRVWYNGWVDEVYQGSDLIYP